MAGVVDPLQVQINALCKRIDDLDRINKERVEALKDSVAAALTSADKAVSKAEMASEKRLESVNEFRAALSDQNTTFMRSSEYNLFHASLVERVDTLSSQLVVVDTTVRNRTASALSGPALAGVAVLLIISIITGAIKLGIDQNQIDNIKGLVDHLVEHERWQDKDSARQDVAIETIKTRQGINEDRLKKLEK